jgi:hypothetical protein
MQTDEKTPDSELQKYDIIVLLHKPAIIIPTEKLNVM